MTAVEYDQVPLEAYAQAPEAAGTQWLSPEAYKAQRRAEREAELEQVREEELADARRRLRPISAADLRESQSKLHRQWLVEGVIAEDHYGVLGAAPKSLKSWSAIDLAVAVASGGQWLRRHKVAKSGPVVLFAGEGGLHELWRRLEAVAKHYEQDLAELPIYVVERVPHLNSQAQMTVVREVLADTQAVLMVLDPAYLAARGGESSNLISMGSLLEELQMVVQDAGCALMVVHHWNKTGTGNGASRFSGAAWAEWGRYLISVETKDAVRTAGKTSVKLSFDLTGGSVAGEAWVADVSVWADDPADLNSALNYEVEVTAAVSSAASAGRDVPEGLRVLMERVSDYLSQCDGGVSLRSIYTNVKGKESGLKNAALELEARGYVKSKVGARNSVEFTHVLPYRRAEDSGSEEYDGGPF